MTLRKLAAYLAGSAAAATVISIAAFEILLGLAIVALLIESRKDPALIRLPPVFPALCVWFVLTILSALASGGHAGAAYPQVKKFYVYLMLIVVYSAFRTLAEVRWLTLAWIAGAALSSSWSLVQFDRKYRAAAALHQNFYQAYVGSRITGFMGHWMTLSGHLMIVLMMLGALAFFVPELLAKRIVPGKRDWKLLALLVLAAVIITAGLLAAFTRSMWLGALVGAIYLIWMWRKWLVLAVPILAGLALAANPFSLRERAISAFEPHPGDTDSNEHRIITRRVGYRMIQAHPWLGVGPEEVGPQLLSYLPPDVHLPLPSGYYGHLHNIYVHYAAERGVPAMLALMWMIGQALFDFFRAAKRAVNARWVLHGAVASTLAVLVSGFYELNLGDSEVLGLFLAILACGYVAVKSSESRPISTTWDPLERSLDTPGRLDAPNMDAPSI